MDEQPDVTRPDVTRPDPFTQALTQVLDLKLPEETSKIICNLERT